MTEADASRGQSLAQGNSRRDCSTGQPTVDSRQGCHKGSRAGYLKCWRHRSTEYHCAETCCTEQAVALCNPWRQLLTSWRANISIFHPLEQSPDRSSFASASFLPYCRASLSPPSALYSAKVLSCSLLVQLFRNPFSFFLFLLKSASRRYSSHTAFSLRVLN